LIYQLISNSNFYFVTD